MPKLHWGIPFAIIIVSLLTAYFTYDDAFPPKTISSWQYFLYGNSAKLQQPSIPAKFAFFFSLLLLPGAVYLFSITGGIQGISKKWRELEEMERRREIQDAQHRQKVKRAETADPDKSTDAKIGHDWPNDT